MKVAFRARRNPALRPSPWGKYPALKDFTGQDLSNMDLSDADLTGANLKGANLKGANLKGANLEDANLEGANLTYANLKGAVLVRAFLHNANLTGANLTGANLNRAELFDAQLRRANINDAYLGRVDLDRANLTKAMLYNANLENAYANDANFTKAMLSHASLDNANLYGANFIGANLISADLYDAHLIRANLTNANLKGANLFGALLTNARLENADLTNAILIDADLTGAYLANANLEGADLTGAKLIGADLTGVDLSKAKNLPRIGPLQDHMRIKPPTSDAFRKWFGKSVVVGDTKNPIVVYHGTRTGGFTEFKPDKRDPHHNAFYFTDTIGVAETYVDRSLPRERPDPALDPAEQKGIYRLYIRLLNPMVVDAAGKKWRELSDWRAPHLSKTYEIAKWAQDHGFDGVIFKNILDAGGQGAQRFDVPATVYAVFDPKAIKSATANNGNFDPSDADIRHNPRRALSMHAGRSTPKSKR